MKAKDYYAKYGAELTAEWEIEPRSTTGLTKLLIDLYQECIDINKLRHGQTKGALQAIAREQNEKWNAIIRLFEKEGNISPLRWNGFMEYVIKTVPDLFPPEITPEQRLEAQIAMEKVREKEQFKNDMIAAAKKLQITEDAVKEKGRDLKNAKFV